jgi:hypothetical protein
MQIGSPGSNEIHASGRVTFQFMVNVADAQSASTIPSSGVAPSLHQFAGPRMQRFQRCGVRERYGILYVTMPWPKWLSTVGSDSAAPLAGAYW